ncbi:cytochrome P450, partial [Lophium mytilinum]
MGFASTASLAVAIIGLYLLWRSQTKPRSLPLPPGPKGLPIVGNLYDLPPEGSVDFLTWIKHRELYGPISSLTILGTTIVLINDKQYATDILDKESAKTSSRPESVFAYEFAGWKKSLALTRDRRLFRQYRKAMAKVLGSKIAVAKFHPLQELESQRFLLRLLKDPKHYPEHLRREAGAFILKVTYGYSILPEEIDPLVSLSESALDWFVYSTLPGKWLVDFFPFMRHIPEWFPGGGFKKAAREVHAHVDEVIEKPLAFTIHQRKQNNHVPSYASDLLDDNELHSDVAWTAMGMYLAGADTTVASLKGFLLAMLLFPEVQRKGQEEIDRVIGRDRLPLLSDRDELPYLNAMVLETMRWHTAGPIALPHRADEDIIYRGNLIPKGATLMPNAWLYNNDPATYPEPRTFRPERFLDSPGHRREADPTENIFGWGRRICPGRLLADSAMFVTIAQTLAAYTMTSPVGPDGKEITPKTEYIPGIVAHLKPFDVNFNLRDPKYEEIIRTEGQQDAYAGDAEILSKVTW